MSEARDFFDFFFIRGAEEGLCNANAQRYNQQWTKYAEGRFNEILGITCANGVWRVTLYKLEESVNPKSWRSFVSRQKCIDFL